ncbi:MAG: extradiol dioxygenase [Ignavibacteriota bacterium]
MWKPAALKLRAFLFLEQIMINGAHTIIYSKDAEADRKFFTDILQFPSVDVGGGWLIFKLPPGEAAFHPDEDNDRHELYFMCDDVKSEIETLGKSGVKCSEIQEERWGSLTSIMLPGGGKIGLYQPKHPTAHSLK